MKVQTSNGTIYYVEFDHVNPITSKLPVADGDAGTYCKIRYSNHTGDIVSQGRTYLHPNDYKAFNKDLGRKESMTRAIKALHLKKNDRRAFWNAYYKRFPKNATKERMFRRLVKYLLPNKEAQQALLNHFLTLKTI